MDSECIKNSPWMVRAEASEGRERSLDVCSVTLHLEESQKRGSTQRSGDQDMGEKNAVGKYNPHSRERGEKKVMKV